VSLTPDEWRSAIEALDLRYHVEDFHVTVVAEPATDQPNSMVLILFDVEHIESGFKFRFGFDLPNNLVPAMTVVLYRVAGELGYEIELPDERGDTSWRPPPPSSSPD
jgi:hypothetical protein